MAKKPRDPFEITLPVEHREKLAIWLSQQLDDALSAKSAQDAEVDYWHMLYEQARTRSARNLPWADAADLTSYLACEKVDALHARMMKTIWVEPVCTVSGYGASAGNAEFVEEFHQYKAEEERLQGVLDRFALISLIEPRGLLEVSEGSEWRTVRKRIQAQVQIDELTGGIVYTEEGEVVPLKKDDGSIVEAQGDVPQAEILLDSTENQRVGPQYRIVPYRDSVILPGHAREKSEIWAYGKKIKKLYPDLVAQSTGPRAIYDKAAVDRLTWTGDTEPDAALERSNTAVAPQDATTAEKELWEVLILIDLRAFFEHWSLSVPKSVRDAEPGPRWYVMTVHKDQHLLLRIQHDDLEKGRYVVTILHPRTDRQTEGFSFVGHKLITTVEEHTAYRNMAADRSSMKNAAPIMRQQGALWDPVEQPMGPRQVIDVRDTRELLQMEVADVPASVFTHIQMQERTAERLAGVNDVASGQVSQETRTLGEIQMATEQSFVRMDLIIHRFQEAIEDLYQIRHAIWKRVLAEKPDGIEAPESLVVGMEGRGVPIDSLMPDKRITAALLEGSFRFKPHGSVETADNGKQRQDFVQGFAFLPQMLQAEGPLTQRFGPQAFRMLMRQFVKLFRIPNPQAFLGSPAQDVMLQQQPPMGGMMPPGMPPLGGAPGLGVGPGLPMGAPGPGAPQGLPPAPAPGGGPLGGGVQ
jgi:hypothetical protein